MNVNKELEQAKARSHKENIKLIIMINVVFLLLILLVWKVVEYNKLQTELRLLQHQNNIIEEVIINE